MERDSSKNLTASYATYLSTQRVYKKTKSVPWVMTGDGRTIHCSLLNTVDLLYIICISGKRMLHFVSPMQKFITQTDKLCKVHPITVAASGHERQKKKR